jgi:septal ring factor EnvC (AmiA/AmiB activator)
LQVEQIPILLKRNAMDNQRLEVIDARLERLTAVCERTAQNVMDISEEIRALTQQTGVLTEGLTEIRLTSERQEQNISRLVGIVEKLIEQKS